MTASVNRRLQVQTRTGPVYYDIDRDGKVYWLKLTKEMPDGSFKVQRVKVRDAALMQRIMELVEEASNVGKGEVATEVGLEGGVSPDHKGDQQGDD